MLEVFFTEESKAEDLFCGLNTARFPAIISLDLGLSLFTMNFSMTLLEQLMKAVVLAEM